MGVQKTAKKFESITVPDVWNPWSGISVHVWYTWKKIFLMLACKYIIASKKKLKKKIFICSIPHMYTDARPGVSNVGDCNTLKLFRQLNYIAT